MPSSNYTSEQQRDIEARVEKAKKMLEQLQLQPSASVQAINTGNDVFSLKVIPYLQDSKFTSPIQV